MSNWKSVIDEMLQPKEKLGSVIEAFTTICEIFETREKMINGSNKIEVDKLLNRCLFSMTIITFWQAHGGVLRPMIMTALASNDPIKTFLTEAIPAALTIADSSKHDEYMALRYKTIELLNK